MRDLEIVLCHLHSRSQPRYPLFTLCPDCRMEAPREAIIVEAVVNYFSTPEFSTFFIDTEHKIQMGADSRRADIMLLDGAENFVAIAECKQTGVVTYGLEQLKSYLCATDTQFGVFANSTEPSDWKFYENLRQNRFREITCDQFETGLKFETGLIGGSQRSEPMYSSRARYARRRQIARRARQQRD